MVLIIAKMRNSWWFRGGEGGVIIEKMRNRFFFGGGRGDHNCKNEE